MAVSTVTFGEQFMLPADYLANSENMPQHDGELI